jgi:hypothetical protein
VKEGYERRRLTKGGIIILLFWGEGSFGFGQVLLDLRGSREFEFCSRGRGGAPVCWGFWARGPGYPYGILELGSCPSWQGGNTVWAELVHGFKLGKGSKVNKTSKTAGRSTRQERLASDQGILIYVFVLRILMNM